MPLRVKSPHANKVLDGSDASLHPLRRGWIRRVDGDLWRIEIHQGDGFLYPDDNVVPRPVRVIAQIMIKADFIDTSGFEQCYCFVRPANLDPSMRR
ncbi:hypothetical protein D3C87_1898760 [compost metagenome]